MIELAGVTVEFPAVRALDQVSLSMFPGEVLGLVGQNGAGKSTLIKVLGGVYRPQRGEIRLDGRAHRFADPADSQRAGIVVVHQELSLVDAMSIAENLLLHELPVRRGLLDRNTLRARARELLLQAGSAGAALAARVDIDTPVQALGVGEKQLVEIARALGRAARLVILDEPTAALSDSEASALFSLIRERAARGTSFLFVSHRLSEVLAVCDRVCVVRDGKLCADRNAKETTSDDLVRAMVGESRPCRSQSRRVSGAPTFTVKRLNLSRGSQRILRDVSFEVRAGERIALFGAVGSGRTALLSTCAGFGRGEISGSFSANGRLAFLPEDRKKQGLALAMSVADNIHIGNFPRRWLRPRALADSAARARQGLRIKAADLDSPVATLSGGNQQKVLLARALKQDPAVLLLDEPTRGVDVAARADIYALLRELCEQGRSVVFASSDADEVLELADRAYVLRDGALVGCLEPPHLSAAELSRLASAGEPLEIAS